MDKVIRHGLEIAAGLDKASQKEMRQVIRDIFVEESHIDFNNPENVKGLRAFADIMKKMFQQAGNTKFDFSKMIELPGPELFDGLKEAAMEFDAVWSNIIQKFGKQSLKDVFMKDQGDLSMALSRLTNKDGQIVKSRIKNIEKAFKEIKITDINKLLNEAMGVETEFLQAESWEEQTAAALRYLNVYDKISKIKNSGDFDVLDIERDLLPVFQNIDKLGSYTVNTLKDIVPQMQASLQNIFNLASGKPLIGLTEGGRVDFEVVPTVIKTLDVGDILGGKSSIGVPITPEIDPKFKEKLQKLWKLDKDASSAKGAEKSAIRGEYYSLYNEILNMFPEDKLTAAENRLERFIKLKNVTDNALSTAWRDFSSYGMASGDGVVSGFETGTGDGSGSGDASSVDLEAERAKVEALQSEIEQKNQELAHKSDEKLALQNDLDEARQQLADAEYTKNLYDSAMNQLTEESNEKDRVIYNLREQLANVKTGTGEEQVSVSSEELKSVLSSIVYNVKIVHDDNDKQANKVAVDESALETTLKRVFANVLNPQTEQNDAEPKNEPWALEKTLLSVKEALDNIQTDTAKPESIEVAPAKTDVGNVLATENTLAAIKTAVESINTKVVKGTKATTSGNSGGKKTGVGKKNAESYAGSQYFPEKLKTQTMYLAKFRAQLMTTGKLTDDVDAQIYELLESLKQVKNGPDFSKWNQQFLQLKTSAGITDIFESAENKDVSASYKQIIEFQKLRNKLELDYEKAQDGSALKQFYAEQLAQMDGIIAKQQKILDNEEYEAKMAKIQTEQARKLGELEAKAATKDAKKAATNAKKLAQREAMLGKAGSAVGRAENTWMSAVGIDGGIPAGFVAEIDEYYQKLDALRKKHQDLKNSDMISEEQKKDLIAQTMSVNKMTEEIGGLVSEYQRLSGDNATVIGANALGVDAGLDEYEQQLKRTVMTATNGKAQIKNFDATTKTLTYTVKTGKNAFTEYTAAVRHLDGQLVSVQGTTKKTETFLEATKRKMKEISSYMSGMAAFSRIGQELKRGIQYVREIDLALTELKKVTNETEEEYDEFLQTAAKTGTKLGSTISAVTEATATFAKLGYTMSQSIEMAEAAIVYKNVGDNIESTGDAADSIISTLKGFGMEASDAMRIVDRFNEVGNNFAITSQGIGEALRLSASALNEGSNSLDESIALITAANEVVNDPSSVGTALKTLTLRLRGSKTELEEMGEDVTDMATTTSQLQAKLLALTGGKVDIMLDANTFKNSTQILREMADAWEDMNDIQRASALELMGGKRQANVLSALIQNFDTVEEVIETSANSAGSALKENEKYLDSIQGKIDQFTNATQSMWSNFLDDDVVKFVVELGTALIKAADALGWFGSLVAIVVGSKLIPWALKAVTGMNTFGESLKYVGLMMTSVHGTGAALIPTIVAQTKALWAGATGANVFSLSLQTLWIAFKTLMATPLGWFLAIGGAIAGIVAIFDAASTSTEELQEELDEMKASLSDVQSELESVNQELETTNDRMAELLAKDHLTFVEQEELENLRQVTAELERQKDALEAQEKYEREKVGKQAARVVDSQRNEVGWWMNGKTEEEEVYDDIDEYLEKQNEIAKIETELANENLSSGLRETLNNQLELLKEQLKAEELDVTDYIDVLTDALDGVKYGDSEQSDAALDYYHNLMDNWNIKQGIEGAKSGAIERIFDKPVFDNTSNEIDNLVDKLKDKPGDQTILDEIREQCELAEEDLQTVGLSVDDAVAYFTQLGQEANFSTLEGKTEEIRKATEKLGDAFRNVGQFMDGDKVNTVAIAEYFKGTSEATRAEIARLVKNINDGKISVEDALKQFEYFGIEATIDIYIKENEVNLEEVTKKIDSIQDAYSALSDAVTQYNENGYLTLDNLQALLSLEPEYLALLQMENGQLSINQSAMETMVQAKLADAKATVIQSAMEQLHALAARTVADEINNSATAASNAVSNLGEYASALGTVSKDAIVAAGAVTALNAAVAGAKANEFVDQSEIDAILSTMNNSLSMIDELGANLSTNFNPIMGNDNDKDKDGKDDTEEDKISDGWEKLLAEYENKLALLSNERDLIQAEIDKAEARGGKASTKYYDDLIRNSNEEKTLLEQKKTALENYLKANAGAIDQDTWTEYNNEINETAVAIKECEVNTIEWAEAIREIDLHYFEQITDEVSRLGDELDFVNSLLEDEEVADENGNWSSAALTRMGMYTQQMEKAATEAAMYQDEIDKVNEQHKKGALSEEQYQEKLSDLISGQQDAIQSYEDAKDGIVELNEARIDAIKDGIDKEIEAYEDLIEAKKEELDAERDLHDFRENIKKQTKEIGELERRISSLSGSSAASDVAERRKLEQQLMEAKEGLNSSYYDHSRDAQSQALDEESEAFQLSKERYIEQLEEQLKDTETLISNSIMDVMLNADTVYNELNILADTYGVTLSDSLTQPWKNASAQAIAWKNELKESMTAGEYAALIGEGGAITAFANGVATKLQGSWTKAQTAAKNYAGYLTGEELKNRFANTLTGFGNQIQAIIDKWNGVKKAADAAYTAQTRTTSVGGNATVSSGSGSGGNGGGNTGSGTTSGAGNTAPKKTSTPTRQSPSTRPTFKKVGDLWSGVGHTGVSIGKKTYDKALEIEGGDGIYYPYTNGNGYKGFIKKGEGYTVLSNGKMDIHTFKPIYQKYAKGTMGTKRDEWAITDESQFGDELVLVPGKDGNLSFMRKGTGVVPADLTQKLFELAQIPTSDLMNKNLTAIVPNITKNDFKNEFNFESLVHVDTVDSDTLPKLEKMVDKKIDDFSRALNYSLKKFAR